METERDALTQIRAKLKELRRQLPLLEQAERLLVEAGPIDTRPKLLDALTDLLRNSGPLPPSHVIAMLKDTWGPDLNAGSVRSLLSNYTGKRFEKVKAGWAYLENSAAESAAAEV